MVLSFTPVNLIGLKGNIMAELIGPPMEPPQIPLLTGDVKVDIDIIVNYLYTLNDFLSSYRPTVTAP